MHAQLAYSGIKVLDFTQGVAGPHATMLLAQHGADVVKVEPLDGDWGRALGKVYEGHCAHSIAFNRGKRSIALDLKTDMGKAVALKMAAECDVLVEAFRPGVMANFGLGYEQIKAQNPSLIYLSVTGFGQTGPNRDLPVTDAVIQAFSGLMTVNRDSQGTPNRLNMIPIDVTTGLYAFQALSSALMRRFRFGLGCYVDNSLMRSAAAFQAAKIMEYHLEQGHAQVLYVPVGTMQTADGFINITAMREQHYKSLCIAIDKPELAEDSRFDTRDKRIALEQELMPIIRKSFLQKTTREWACVLTAAGVMNSPVQDYGEFLAHPQTLEARAVAYVEHDGVGSVPMPHIPGLPRIDGPSEMTHAPHIGEHTVAILEQYGYDQKAIDGFITAGIIAAHQSESRYTPQT